MVEGNGAAPARPAGQSFAEYARRERRGAVLDAAGELMRDRGWRNVRMSDVADRAGISRQTLYVEFGSREGLAQEAVLREVQRFLSGIAGALQTHAHDAQEAVSAAFDTFLAAMAENSLLRAVLLDDDNAELLQLLTTHGAPILDAARARLTSFIRATWPDTDPADADLMSESTVRLAISVATLPTETSHLTSIGFARLIGPFVREITGASPPA